MAYASYRKQRLILFGVLFLLFSLTAFAQNDQSHWVHRELDSKSIVGNKLGISTQRKIAVYLPSGYDSGSTRYPVIYLLYDSLDAEESQAQILFDKAIAAGAIGRFILVCANMSTPAGTSWYVNSPVTGNWEDFLVQELVPYIDQQFRTLSNGASRGITGSFFGGYGALHFGMKYPKIFGTVYAMHPVGTGSGVQIMLSRPNWTLLAQAKSLDDAKKDLANQIFTTIFQAHIPDPEKPPLFFDPPAHLDGKQLVIDTALTEKLRNNFFLESQVPQYAENLKSLRGLKFDWSRNDSNADHIYSNQALTHKLNEFGIPHEAEEYNGLWGKGIWNEEGRFYTEVLPFFQQHLVFDKAP